VKGSIGKDKGGEKPNTNETSWSQKWGGRKRGITGPMDPCGQEIWPKARKKGEKAKLTLDEILFQLRGKSHWEDPGTQMKENAQKIKKNKGGEKGSQEPSSTTPILIQTKLGKGRRWGVCRVVVVWGGGRRGAPRQ